jgi:hypothetical protein
MIILIVVWLIGAIVTCVAFGYFCDEDTKDKVIVSFFISISWPIVLPTALIFVSLSSITQSLIKLGENLRRKK